MGCFDLMTYGSLLETIMIVVTGGAGFIGSNIVKGLNARGQNDIVVVDDLTDGTKFKNIVDCCYP